MDAGFPRVGQHLRPGPARVRRVLGVGVQDGAIVVQARQRRQPRRVFRIRSTSSCARFQASRRHPFDRTVLSARAGPIAAVTGRVF